MKLPSIPNPFKKKAKGPEIPSPMSNPAFTQSEGPFGGEPPYAGQPEGGAPEGDAGRDRNTPMGSPPMDMPGYKGPEYDQWGNPVGEAAQQPPAPAARGGQSLKDEIGYPDESPAAPYADDSQPASYDDVPQTEDPFAAAIDAADEPPMAEPLPAEHAEPSHSTEDIQEIAKSIADGVRDELESKIQSLEDEVDTLRKLDNQISQIVDALSRVEKKYEAIEEKVGTVSPEVEEDLKEIKATVNNLNNILSAGLPALITEVRESKK